MQNTHRLTLLAAAGLSAAAITALPGCFGSDDCEETRTCDTGGTGTGAGGNGGVGASQGGGGSTTAGDGGGGAGSCDPACGGDTPICDDNNECVACVGDDDCNDPMAAKCDAGVCVECDSPIQCEGIGDAALCEAGKCVECALGDEDACTGGDTCDLLTGSCVAVGPGSVGNCEACSNDNQCETGKCIPMEFEGSLHGYYCLDVPAPTCARPFQIPISQPSVSGLAATTYCGIEEDLATCEAVLALQQGWACTGTDGMCSALVGGTEIPVPGAICKPVGVGGDACTYSCDSTPQCPSGAPQNSCGSGVQIPPGWCGG